MHNDKAATRVLEVLREAVGNPDLTPEDDFYAAGGHSLLIMRIVRTLRVEHGITLSPRAFWVDAQVAALMAAAVPADQDTEQGSREP